MDRPTDLTQNLERKEIERAYAVAELNNIAEIITAEIKELKSSGITSILLSCLITQKENFTSDEVGEELRNLITEIEVKIAAEKSLSELEGIEGLLTVFRGLATLSPFAMSIVEVTKIIDSYLVEIANSTTIPLKTKNKFFELLKTLAEEKNNQNILADIKANGEVPTNRVLPINIHYVLDADNSIKRTEKLRSLKRFIKKELATTKVDHVEDSDESIFSKYGDYVVDPEAQDWEIERRHDEIVDSNIQINATDNTSDLKTLLNSEDEYVSLDTYRLAKTQLLRIYREFINSKLSGVTINQRLVDEQTGVSGDTTSDPLRFGGDDSEEKGKTRSRATRRIALFDSAHLGLVKAHAVNFALDNRNYLPVSQNLIDFWLEEDAKQVEVSNVREKLSAPQIEMLKQLEGISDYKLPQKKSAITTELTEQEKNTPDGLPEKIIQRVLEKMHLASDPETAIKQINAFDSLEKPEENNGKFAVKVKRTGNFAIEGNHRLFVMGETQHSPLPKLMASIAHEFGHIFQIQSWSESTLPGLKSLESGLGRSDTIAESGAIKLEALMKSLFGIEREVNTYHFDVIRMIAEGKNYWEIFNEIFRIIKDRSERNNENKSNKIIAKNAQKAITRALGNLGAIGSTNNGRYPTSAGSTFYTYQALTEYSNQPFYVSGIPSNREDLKDFLPQPIIDGEPVTEEFIIGTIIEATYEILTENNIIKAEAHEN